MSEKEASPNNPMTIKRVRRGQIISRTLGPTEYMMDAAPEDGFLIREDVGQKLRGRPIYVRASDLKKAKALQEGEELVVYPWECE